MKTVYVLAILMVITSCKDANKSEYIKADKTDTLDFITSESHPGKKIIEAECYICHDATTPEESRIAPPMIAIKTRYIDANTTKEEFEAQIWDFVSEPTREKAIMYGAVNKFGVMPYQAFSKEKITLISEYIYDFKIAQPEWFEEHYQKSHGSGQGMGRQQRFGQNTTIDDYSKIGLNYALSTKAQLGKNLTRAIKEKGADGAVEFCNIEAMKLTDSMSVMHNAIIKRVSDKARNPKNMANVKELEHITAFKESLKAGSKIEPIVEEINGEVNIYYPITTNTMCLQCHGSPNEHISTTTLSTLKKLYPNDQATGYDVDQVRGMWSINFESNSLQ